MTNQQAPEIYALHTVPNKGERPWSGIYAVRADAEHDAKVLRDVTGRDWSVVRLVVADTATTPSPTPRADSQPAPEYVGNGMFKGETIEKAAEHWANWCDVRCMTGLSEFLRVVAARAPADSVLEDAARYRYLRDGDWREHEKLESVIRLQLNALWDETIDAARKQGANQ